MRIPSRRFFLKSAGVSAVATVAATAAPMGEVFAAPLSLPAEVPAKDIRVGDLVLGQHNEVVRIAFLEVLPTGRIRLRFNQDVDADMGFFGFDTYELKGFPRQRPLLLIKRGVSHEAIDFY